MEGFLSMDYFYEMILKDFVSICEKNFNETKKKEK